MEKRKVKERITLGMDQGSMEGYRGLFWGDFLYRRGQQDFYNFGFKCKGLDFWEFDKDY